MHVISIVGARPQFVKLSPVAHALEHQQIKHSIIHTGQHYDSLLSDVFFRDLDIPAPVAHLGVGSGSHGVQTGAILAALDGKLPDLHPDCVIVFGDTNSTLAGALAAAKLHIRIAHVEAGLRSYNRFMPEEINRILTDHAADLLLAPTQTAAEHLASEGLAARTVIVGDVMTDVLFEVRNMVSCHPSPITLELGFAPGTYSIATIHRAENTDNPERLNSIIDSLARLDHPVVLLAHPRLLAKSHDKNISLSKGVIIVHSPLTYPDLICAILNARSVVTDSGGLQKEAFLLGVPCTTVRAETEWVETVDLGWNDLVEPGDDLVASVSRPRPLATTARPYGDGHAAIRVGQEFLRHQAVRRCHQDAFFPNSAP